MTTPDPYAALGVPRTATREEIARAYRTAVKRSHPDTGARTSPAQMARITEAWRILGDPIRRARWDREHAARFRIEPPHWASPMPSARAVRPAVAQAPPSRMDSGWVAVAVIGMIALAVAGVMTALAIATDPPSFVRAFDGDEVSFEYPDTWTLSAPEESDGGPRRVLAHLTSFSTGDDERCLVFAERCRWEGEALPAGGASVQLFSWKGVPPPDPEPNAGELIGGEPSVHGRTTVADEFLSAWWQLSPPGFPDRWIEVRAEIRGGDFERGQRMAEISAMLDSLAFR